MVVRNFLIGLCLTLTTIAEAQKLSDKQNTGLRAPRDIKIDGSAAEWNNQFQAYNHATGIYYSISNDDENLYLTVQALEPEVISRIMGGGITLGIQISDKKQEKNIINITYPVIEHVPYFKLTNKKREEPDVSAKAADSLMIRNNALLEKNCKFIRVNGISGLDSLISVYNVYGIKAAGLFNDKRVYTCEISIKLKLIQLSANDATKFAYHILLNGKKVMGVVKAFGIVPGSEDFMKGLADKANEINDRQSVPTDFWGEYTLVKK